MVLIVHRISQTLYLVDETGLGKPVALIQFLVTSDTAGTNMCHFYCRVYPGSTTGKLGILLVPPFVRHRLSRDLCPCEYFVRVHNASILCHIQLLWS